MTASDARVALVKIHGIGNQPQNWHEGFAGALNAIAGISSARMTTGTTLSPSIPMPI